MLTDDDLVFRCLDCDVVLPRGDVIEKDIGRWPNDLVYLCPDCGGECAGEYPAVDEDNE